MLTIFLIPLLAALLALALNRLIATRWLGVASAAALLASAAALIIASNRGTLLPIAQPWLTLDNQTITLTLAYDAASLPLAVLVTAGGALAVLALALALPAHLRGYSGLIAAVMLALGATLIGIATSEPLLLPLAWAALTLLAFVALRASGGQTNQPLPVGLLANLLGAVFLLGGALSVRFGGAGGDLPPVALASLLGAGMLALGTPPLHRTVSDVAEAPAHVAAPLLAFGMPLLGGYTLLRFATENMLPDHWRVGVQLLGALTLIICAAAALNERRLRQIVGWLMSAQLGLFLVALGLSHAATATIAPALLLNAALSSAATLLAVGVIERHAGTDDLSEIRLDSALLLPGVALIIAAASALGAPGAWGFWPVRWLFDELQTDTPLLIGPLLAGSALCAMAWVAPVVAFLRTHESEQVPARTDRSRLLALCPLLMALPLALLGVAPRMGWNMWGAAARGALLGRDAGAIAAPTLPGAAGSTGALLALLAIIALPLLLRRSARHATTDSEVEASGVIAPTGLGASLRGLGWLGAPGGLFAQIWEWLIALSRGVGWLLSFFEQRYYMAGLMLAVVAVILLLLQG